jgi:hypothetical protein
LGGNFFGAELAHGSNLAIFRQFSKKVAGNRFQVSEFLPCHLPPAASYSLLLLLIRFLILLVPCRRAI